MYHGTRLYSVVLAKRDEAHHDRDECTPRDEEEAIVSGRVDDIKTIQAYPSLSCIAIPPPVVTTRSATLSSFFPSLSLSVYVEKRRTLRSIIAPSVIVVIVAASLFDVAWLRLVGGTEVSLVLSRILFYMYMYRSSLFPSFPSLVEMVETGPLCERGRRHGGWKKREPNP